MWYKCMWLESQKKSKIVPKAYEIGYTQKKTTEKYFLNNEANSSREQFRLIEPLCYLIIF